AINGIKELPLEFDGRGEVSGWHFKQLMKSNTAYLYEKSFEDLKYYEVFRRRINTRFGCVAYPSSKSFGIWAWDYRDNNKALAKFQGLF
ncbi:MAG: hypothetical protein JXK95_09190, partial [Bacteroidales bacterium]|nr:hypothetical protein [Bacteroidales bacterium]